MKKVLIITYYWPPSGGAGVQRWLKFVKYLREFGWEPVVYTPENPEAPAIDNSLQKDIPKNLTVLKTKIWEPYNLYKGFIGQKKDEKINAGFLTEKKKPGLTEKISVWIRGNWFIPDARKFWINPSIDFLSEHLKKNPVDAMVSTGPPHSMHLIALGIKKKLNIPWLADFRDPWTNIDFYDKLMLTKFSDAKHKKMELEVLKNADKVVSVSWSWAKDFQKIYSREVDVITNGFDEADFIYSETKLHENFSISHIGAMNKDRNPHQFWMALKELVNENKHLKNILKIRLIGKNDISVLESLEKNGLNQFTELISYLPHDEVMKQICSSQVLLLPLNDTPNIMGIIPGKIFEYLAAKRPIFAIGNPKGDSARIISETNAGIVCDFKDKEKMKEELLKMLEQFTNKSLSVSSSDIATYSRKNKTAQMAALLDSIA
ncbi:MAG: glycosyltransferase family 4 protein [Bacteroidetes bacterium]|nr:glycosyltransferase family 4 protein [Bacteroidota bacterium]